MMKEKMKWIMLFSTLMLMFLSGCGMYYHMETNIHADGSGILNCTAGYDEAAYQKMINENIITQEEFDAVKANATQITVDNKIYYCSTETILFSSGEQLETALIELGLSSAAYTAADTFFLYNAPIEDVESAEGLQSIEGIEGIENMEDAMYMEISVTFPSPITKYNDGGVLSNDNKTITWDYAFLNSGKDLYATTADTVSRAISVNIKPKNYKRAQVIKTSGGAGSVYLDGVRVESNKTKAQNGVHTLIVLNKNGTKKKIEFIVDTKAPVIQGAKNNRTYKKNVRLGFADYESGIKSVTVNGRRLSQKAIKNGYTIKKNGSYKVQVIDNVKNKKMIKFSVKK